MFDEKKVSDVEAIRQVIAEGDAADFIDIVNDVKKRFRMDVTSSQVEQVYHELVKQVAEMDEQTNPRDKEISIEQLQPQGTPVVSDEKPRVRADSRVSFQMTTKIPDDPAVATEPTKATIAPAKPMAAEPSEPLNAADVAKNDLAHALFFVKSVGNLARAKSALAELESMLRGSD